MKDLAVKRVLSEENRIQDSRVGNLRKGQEFSSRCMNRTVR